MLLVQSIHITDKFGFAKQQQSKPTVSSSETVFYATPDHQGFCVNALGKTFLVIFDLINSNLLSFPRTHHRWFNIPSSSTSHYHNLDIHVSAPQKAATI
jgi:hypothetical protein